MKFARVKSGVVQELILVPANVLIADMLHPSLVQQCVSITDQQFDTVKSGWTYINGVFAEPAPVVQEPMPFQVLKSAFWRRCTGPEAEALDAALNAAPARLRRLFSDSTILESNSEEWPDLMAGVAAVVGEARAAELLAAS